MKHLDGLLTLIGNEIGSVVQNGKFRSREEIDSVYKLIDIAKDTYCIWKYEDEMDGGYSESYSRGGYPDRHSVSYDDGVSYGRGRNARRDSMGRYSRGDGRSEYVEELKELMRNAPDENTRQSIQHMISQIENG